MNRVDLFNNLVVMAAVDGAISDEEAAYLAQRAARWGITEEEAQHAIKNAMASEREFTVPPTKPLCLAMLKEIIQMMQVDGDNASIEKSLCDAAAAAMNISRQEMKDVLASLK
jgi:uncharacterized tellurite resistance protein B-like protein